MSRIQVLIVFFCALPLGGVALASQKSECGTFDIKGVLTQTKAPESRFELVVFRGSRSETRLALKDPKLSELFPYVNRPVHVTGKVLKPIRYYRGEIEIQKIEFSLPDYLRPDHGDVIKPVKISTCR